jgi:two-component system sensor histidine kinase KdpD
MRLMAELFRDNAVGMQAHGAELLLIAAFLVFPAMLILARVASRNRTLEALVGQVLPVLAPFQPLPIAASLGVPSASPFQLESERLCTFIRETTQLDPRRKPGHQLAASVRTIFEMESVAIFDADLEEVYKVGEWSEDVRDVLKNICVFETLSDDTETGLSRRVLRMGNLPIGAMITRGETHGRMTDAIASVVAITFDRYHAFANESRTESARQAEQLRTTVLDSLAHAYKTPLTVIATASEGIGALGRLTAAQTGLVAQIDEQIELLTRLTNRLLRTARLQSSEMIPQAEKVAIAPLMEDVVASLRDQLASVTVKVSISRDDLCIQCDRSLLIALLTQYVDNAGKYGAAGSVVTIQAVEHATEVIFSVHSMGPVIPAADYERIFDRYFRSSALSNRAPGTGIGLSVAKRAAQAQGGHVWVTSDRQKGTTFYAALPTVPQGGVRL